MKCMVMTIATAILVLLTPAVSVAQLQMSGGFGASFPGPIRSFPVGPLGVPFRAPSFHYNSSLNIRVGTPFGPSIGYRQRYTGALGWYLSTHDTALAPRYYTYPARPPSYNTPSSFLRSGGNSGYMSGGAGNSQLFNAQTALGRAQQQSSTNNQYSTGARAAIAEQWDFEKGNRPANAPAAPGPGSGLPQDLIAALEAQDDDKLMSGEYLNRIGMAIGDAEKRGGRGPTPQFGPQLLEEIRFAGSPAADAFMVIRRAGNLEFPSAFASIPALTALQPALEQDIVAVASPVRIGKPADPLKVAKFEADVKKAQQALTPELANLPFEEAVAARRFLNQLDSAAKVLRDQRQVAGLFNPQWETAGVSVEDLVKFMDKHKIRFGAGEANAVEAYLAVHQGFSNYLFVLEQSIPQKK